MADELGIAPALPFVGMGVMLVIAGAVFLRQSRVSRRLRARVTGTPKPIAGAAPGPTVEVRGSIVTGSGGTLRAPVSGRDVVWYRVAVEEHLAHREPGAYEEIDCVADGVPFLVDDASGEAALVDPTGANVPLDVTASVDVMAGTAPPDGIAALLRHRSGKDEVERARHRRYHETSLAAGDGIYVAGPAKRIAGAPRPTEYRSTAATMLSFARDPALGDDGGLLLSTASGAGVSAGLARVARIAWGALVAGVVLLVGGVVLGLVLARR